MWPTAHHSTHRASWFILYGIEVFAIVQIAQRYPDDAEAAVCVVYHKGVTPDHNLSHHLNPPIFQKKAMTDMVTLPRKMLPVRLQIMKRLLLAGNPTLATPAAATATAAPPTISAFVDAPAPPSIAPPAYPPTLPQGTTTTAPPKEEEATLEDDLATRRRKRGLRPGQLDVSTGVINRRKKELADRGAYMRNFWYAAGTMMMLI